MSITTKLLDIKFEKLLLVISIFSITSALMLEYIFGYKPCALCIYARYPYLALGVISSMHIMLEKYDKIFNTFYLITIIVNIIIGAYHSGVEMGIFDYNYICQSSIKLQNANNIDEYHDLIEMQNYVPCNKADFTIFFLSLANINVILNMILLALGLKKCTNSR